jgi:uncharacterized circularly permuted ATP-grasp superfamily protein
MSTLELRPVACMECGITFSTHPDFLNHLAAVERHDEAFMHINRDLIRQKRDLIAALEDILSIPLGADAEAARTIARNTIRRLTQ